MVYINRTVKRFSRILILLACLLAMNLVSKAQENPPRPMSVTTFQNLSFGAIIQGYSGGTVIIYPSGSRSVTGDILQANLGYSYYPAIFEVGANPGTLVTIINGPDAVLNGSNGGSMTLHLGDTDPPSPFINTLNPSGLTQVRVGGTLSVGNSLVNPAGSYSGTFSVTFIQQ
ncbi:MAG: DUF4402 domain-containing protein [Bacteroidetes bacterium]|nr:DUF4402 domain-containing protein [Bacteroidota bacterium]